MAGIIKSGKRHGRGGGPQAAVFNFDDMSQKAEEYLQRVRKQADAILDEARERARQVEQEAFQQAQRQAEAEIDIRLQGMLNEKLDNVLPSLKAAAQEIKHAKQSWLARWEQETIKLAIAIAERIARRAFREQPQITTDLLREALQLAVGGGRVKVQFHPDELESFGPWVEKLAKEMNELLPTDVVGDAGVSPGGCRVVTQFGAIDQTIEAQLARIAEELE